MTLKIVAGDQRDACVKAFHNRLSSGDNSDWLMFESTIQNAQIEKGVTL